MNYEQKYHEALERAKKMQDSIIGSHNPESAKLHVGHIENIFPELRESEDEIHRKWILEYLYDGLRKSDEQFKDQFKSAIAYLEKLKEQKVDIDKLRKDIYQSGYNDGYQHGREDELKEVLDATNYHELTWEDMRTINDLFYKVDAENSAVMNDDLTEQDLPFPYWQKFYEEVLRRFRKMKNK